MKHHFFSLSASQEARRAATNAKIMAAGDYSSGHLAAGDYSSGHTLHYEKKD